MWVRDDDSNESVIASPSGRGNLKRTILMTRLICLGQIVAAHGIKGEVKIKTFTSDPENLTKYGPLINQKQESIAVKITSAKSPTTVIATIDGITTRNQAETLKNVQLFIFDDQLPPSSADEIYYEKVIGLPLVANGKTLGNVTGVFDFGAGSFCEVKTPEGKIGTIHMTSCNVLADRLECDEEHFLV